MLTSLSHRLRRLPNPGRQALDHDHGPGGCGGSSGFSLVELMVVVGIIAIVMTVSVPFLRTAIDTPKGMKGAFKVLDETCKEARAMAILQQTMTELRIRSDGTLEVSAVGQGSLTAPSRLESKDLSGKDWRMPDRGAGGGGPGTGPKKLPEGVGIEAILANGEDVTELEVARVRFFPNGTCDELQLVLYYPENNERRMVWLDVVTAIADFETDPSKFKLQ